ncbi:hypothetical protein [Paenibacillus turpanensis]|uniref:hypothetical protein n=1 Tax=Paenibacillus turpanensis TaxID=2689078 RepID=UPI0014095987|nr:hypothetical protein [Paenibacillus turpanensis]
MFELVLFLYWILCAVILGIRHRKDRKEFMIRFAIVASLPGLGFLLPPFRRGKRRDSETRAAELQKYLDTIIQGEDISDIIRKPEAEKEINVVPLQESLLVNDLTTRRRMMIDLLKQDSLEYLEVLKMAVSNDDTETSHYAVSAIMEVKRKLSISLQELAVQYEEDKNNPHVLRSYADVLKNYIRSGFLDKRTVTKHQYTYSLVLERLIEVLPNGIDAYTEKIEIDLELGEFASAERTAKRFLEQFPILEEAYLALLKVYYSIRSFSQLNAVLADLKQSPVRLSNRGINAVRFWSEEVRHEVQDQA